MIHDLSESAAFTLSQAILLYTRQAGNGDEQATATVHKVALSARSKMPIIMEGKPLSQRELISVLQAMKHTRKASILPANVLVCTDKTLVWWAPAQSRNAWFNQPGKGGLGNVSGLVHYPSMVFMVHDGIFNCYALKTNSRPDADTPLFHAPLMNVWDKGAVCTGNVQFPKDGGVGTMKEWEDALFDSYFTHTNHSAPIKGYKGGLTALYRKMLKGGFKAFPVQYLNPFKKTLGQLIEAL